MKRILIFSLVFLSTLTVFAQTELKKSALSDPLDVTKEVEQIELYGVPTFSTVAEMRNKADALYEAQSWKEAAEAYEQFAKHANWLANIISQCVEPYYSANYDDKKNMSYTRLKTFIPYETASNKLKEGRNIGYIRIGLCYKNLGDINKAIAYLHKGLDILSIDQYTEWEQGATAIAEIVGFDSNTQ